MGPNHHVIESAALGVSFKDDNTLRCSTYLTTTNFSVIGVKFNIGYHNVKLSLPINVMLVNTSQQLYGCLLTLSLVGAGVGVIGYLYGLDKGDRFSFKNVEEKCQNQIKFYENEEGTMSIVNTIREQSGLNDQIVVYMAVFVDKENSKNLENLISKIWEIANRNRASNDKTEAFMEAQKERKNIQTSEKHRFIHSDITGKIIQEILEKNKIDITFDTLLSESADPSLWEHSSIELITIYSVGQRVFFSRYNPDQRILISGDMVVSGVVNKLRNVLNYWL